MYGPRKVWRQMDRENLRAARCRVRRLMRAMGLAGAVRGRAWTTTTQSQPEVKRPGDLVDRNFTATRPNQLRVSDFPYVATWRGFVYVPFVIDVFARRIVGWRVSIKLCTLLALDAPAAEIMRGFRRNLLALQDEMARQPRRHWQLFPNEIEGSVSC